MYNYIFNWYHVRMSEKVGFVGWRGMVGSVLRERMLAEGDFDGIEPVFLSTSQAGQAGPTINGETYALANASDLVALAGLKAIVTCQGSDYTREIHGKLRDSGWDGYWIDAASELRMSDSSVLLLDPVNRKQIDKALDSGVKDLIGANCASSLQLMGLAGLFQNDIIEWANPNTYQAVSGAGARHVTELLRQMRSISQATADIADDDPAATLTRLDRISDTLRSADLPTDYFNHPIAGNVLPWIDKEASNGQSREEWKAGAEINKILGTSKQSTPIDGLCVRVGSFRSHAQAVTMKLKRDLPLNAIENMISSANEWVKLVPNNRQATLEQLTPVAVSGTLDVAVGRLRKLSIGPEYLTAFVVGDQLLWGATEPLRRALNIVIDRSE